MQNKQDSCLTNDNSKTLHLGDFIITYSVFIQFEEPLCVVTTTFKHSLLSNVLPDFPQLSPVCCFLSERFAIIKGWIFLKMYNIVLDGTTCILTSYVLCVFIQDKREQAKPRSLLKANKRRAPRARPTLDQAAKHPQKAPLTLDQAAKRPAPRVPPTLDQTAKATRRKTLLSTHRLNKLKEEVIGVIILSIS